MLAAASNAAAQSPVITAVPHVVPAGSDYPTDVLGNPWDFSDVFDLSPHPGEFTGWTISANTARTTGRDAFLSSGRLVAHVSVQVSTISWQVCGLKSCAEERTDG
jgi:hypothetical protein